MSSVKEIHAALWFSQVMVGKLASNMGKPGWEQNTQQQLLARLHEEVTELEIAIGTKSAEEVIQEATDVANFAMMIADKSRAGLPAQSDAVRIADSIRNAFYEFDHPSISATERLAIMSELFDMYDKVRNRDDQRKTT